ncbi:MAG: diguanylate cyclase [Spirochaetaceae bacterium]
MNIKYKTSLIVVILFSLITISVSMIQSFVVLPAFLSLEKKEAANNMKRIVDALNNEIDHLDTLCNDWATWDDTYNFVMDNSDEFISSNLTDQIFNEIGLSLIYIINTEGDVIWGKVFDLENNKEINLKNFPQDNFVIDHPIINIKNNIQDLSEYKIVGVYNTEKGPVLITTELILTSEAEGPSHGFMIMGIILNDDIIKKISAQTSVEFDIIDLYNNSDIEAYKSITDSLNKKPLYIEENSDDSSYNLYSYYYDIEGNPSFLIKIVFPRTISKQGKRIIKYATISIIIAGIIVLLLIILLLNKYILYPILKLDKHMTSIMKNNDFSIRLGTESKDEIGDLTRAFNYFITKIEKQRLQLKKLSTIDALTNIGNRRKFDETLLLEWNRQKRFKKNITLLLIDIDYFKNYNDYYGHQAGDECLKKIGQLLAKKTKRAGELAARYGGEEFGLIFSNNDNEDIIKLTKSLLADMKELNIRHAKSEIAEFVTFSIGIAFMSPKDNDEIKDFILMADKALYRAKESGRNQYCIF